MEANKIKCGKCGQVLDSETQFHPNDCCISFKAGLEEEREQQRNKTVGIMREALQEERQQGRREVVEWLRRNPRAWFELRYELPSKLKEWGLQDQMPPEEHSPEPAHHHNKNILGG